MHAEERCECGRSLPKKAKRLLYKCHCGLTWVACEKLIYLLVQKQLATES
jgi:hypothetical protein